MVPENLLHPVLAKKVKEVEAAEKAQVKGQKAQDNAQDNAQEQDGQMAGKQKQEPQQQTAVTDVKQSGTKTRKRLSAGGL